MGSAWAHGDASAIAFVGIAFIFHILLVAIKVTAREVPRLSKALYAGGLPDIRPLLDCLGSVCRYLYDVPSDLVLGRSSRWGGDRREEVAYTKP